MGVADVFVGLGGVSLKLLGQYAVVFRVCVLMVYVVSLCCVVYCVKCVGWCVYCVV